MNQSHAATPTLPHNATISTAPVLLRGFEPAEPIQASAWRLLSARMSGGKSLMAR